MTINSILNIDRHLKKRGKYYHFDKQKGDTRYRVSLGTQDIDIARAAAIRILKREFGEQIRRNKRVYSEEEVSNYIYCPQYWYLKGERALYSVTQFYRKIIHVCWMHRNAGNTIVMKRLEQWINKLEKQENIDRYTPRSIKKRVLEMMRTSNEHIKFDKVKEIGVTVSEFGVDVIIDVVLKVGIHDTYVVYDFSNKEPSNHKLEKGFRTEIVRHYAKENSRYPRVLVVWRDKILRPDMRKNTPGLEKSITGLTNAMNDNIIIARTGPWCQQCDVDKACVKA